MERNYHKRFIGLFAILSRFMFLWCNGRRKKTEENLLSLIDLFLPVLTLC